VAAPAFAHALKNAQAKAAITSNIAHLLRDTGDDSGAIAALQHAVQIEAHLSYSSALHRQQVLKQWLSRDTGSRDN